MHACVCMRVNVLICISQDYDVSDFAISYKDKLSGVKL